MLHLLRNTIQPYAWGSHDALTELYGVENPDAEPMAELWMGAHPKAPSMIAIDHGERSLRDYLAAHPDRTLGAAARTYGGELPFLFKILCAAQPLSIQVHPTLEQARAGFAAEDEAGIDRGAPDRNYRDANHKPELICAIRPFWGLRGFRGVSEIHDELVTVEFREADATLEPPESEDDLGPLFRSLLQSPEAERRELIAAAVALAGSRWYAAHPAGALDEELPDPGDPLARYYWVLRIADEYPGDAGILAPLLLNVFSLLPGQATYQPAGVLHAYLHGVGVELMANSDNVLRGGLTVKHIDVDELLTVGTFRSTPAAVLDGDREEAGGCTVIRYETPFDEFAFSRLLPGPECRIDGGRAQILFCHEGPIRLEAGGDEVQLAPGQAAFVDAETESVEAHGTGELFRATIPG